MTIEEKYNIVFINGKRYYLKNIDEVEYDLIGSKTYSFEYKNIYIKDTSWKNTVYKLACELNRMNPKDNDYLITIKSFWTNTYLFLANKQTNTIEFNGIYINLGQDANKFSWMIKQLLEIYGIPTNECKFVIERKGKSEPKEARKYFHNLYLEEYRKYLKDIKKFDEEKAEEQIIRIKELSAYQARQNTNSYDNLFDFDSAVVFSNYADKLIHYLDDHVYYSDRVKMNNAKEALNLLQDFINYRNRMLKRKN